MTVMECTSCDKLSMTKFLLVGPTYFWPTNLKFIEFSIAILHKFFVRQALNYYLYLSVQITYHTAENKSLTCMPELQTIKGMKFSIFSSLFGSSSRYVVPLCL